MHINCLSNRQIEHCLDVRMDVIVRALTDPASREDGAPLMLFHDNLQLAAGQAILQQVNL